MITRIIILTFVICSSIFLAHGFSQDRKIFKLGTTNPEKNAEHTNISLIQKLPQLLSDSSRFKRSSDHIITECIFMTSDEGVYYYKATDDDANICGIYIVADPNQIVEIRFNYFDVPCSNGGLVVVVDGWELNGELFPSPRDFLTTKKGRFSEYCDERKIKKTFLSTSNVALVQYRMPFKGSGFTITVRFIKNPTPCNVLLQGIEEEYTLRNYGKHSNCSVSTLFASAVRIGSIDVGVFRANIRGIETEIGTIHKCHKRGLDDYVQIGGAIGLDNADMLVADTLCGLNYKPGNFEEFIACGTTTIRLVSSGAFDNSITLNLRQLNPEDIKNSFMSILCPIQETEK